MLNGVTGRHLNYVESLLRKHPQIPWDTIAGPRGKGRLVANLQNECIRRYPNSLYFKIDEDVFVPPGWEDRMIRAYEDHRSDSSVAMLTPVIPNNAMGFHYLLNQYPQLADEYATQFSYPLTNDCTGPVWQYPKLANWITRHFLVLSEANIRLQAVSKNPFPRFAQRFSINCLVYDYHHWQELGGIPDEEEPAWTQWIADHGKEVVLVTNTLLHHYSFFVQQDWLDRTPLLEDIRIANAPQSLSSRTFTGYHLPRMVRFLNQMPRVLKQRISKR